MEQAHYAINHRRLTISGCHISLDIADIHQLYFHRGGLS